MSASRPKLASACALLALVALLAAAPHCAPTPPSAVDVEALGADLALCVARDARCVTRGDVKAVEALFPGDDAMQLGPGGRLSLPLQKPVNASRLAYLVIGLKPLVAEGAPRTLNVHVAGRSLPLSPANGWVRTELELVDDNGQRGIVPSPDARVELEAERGVFDVVYIVGRWLK